MKAMTQTTQDALDGLARDLPRLAALARTDPGLRDEILLVTGRLEPRAPRLETRVMGHVCSDDGASWLALVKNVSRTGVLVSVRRDEVIPLSAILVCELRVRTGDGRRVRDVSLPMELVRVAGVFDDEIYLGFAFGALTDAELEAIGQLRSRFFV